MHSDAARRVASAVIDDQQNIDRDQHPVRDGEVNQEDDQESDFT